MMRSSPSIAAVAIRFSAWMLSLMVLLALAGVPGLTWVIPLLGHAFDVWAGDLRLVEMAIQQSGPDTVLKATATWKHIVIFHGRAIYPDPRALAEAFVPAWHVLLAPLLMFCTLLAWPRIDGHRLLWIAVGRVFAAGPLCLLLVVVDVPTILAAEMWELIRSAQSVDDAAALVAWKRFMVGGGRYALALAAATLAVSAGQALASHMARRTAARRERALA